MKSKILKSTLFWLIAGLVLSVLMVPSASGELMNFTDAGTSLLITIFALQDSFGTACNITGDGALTMIVNKRINKTEPGFPD